MTENEELRKSNNVLAGVIAVLMFIVTTLFIVFILSYCALYSTKDKAIKLNYAHYNARTGIWEWNSTTKIDKPEHKE